MDLNPHPCAWLILVHRHLVASRPPRAAVRICYGRDCCYRSAAAPTAVVVVLFRIKKDSRLLREGEREIKRFREKLREKESVE